MSADEIEIKVFAYELRDRVNRQARSKAVRDGIAEIGQHFQILTELLEETPIPDLQPVISSIRTYLESHNSKTPTTTYATSSGNGTNVSVESPTQAITPLQSTRQLTPPSVHTEAIEIYVPSRKPGRVESVKVISDGRIKYDGGALFGSFSRMKWDHQVTIDRAHRITLGLNSLLVQMHDGENVLIDAGVGSKYRDKSDYALQPSRLRKNLRVLGLAPRDINKVILTHLGFDHCGGSTIMNRYGEYVPTFPRATYYVQSRSLEEARNPSSRRSGGMYHEPDFRPLEEYGALELLDGNSEISPGIGVVMTGDPKIGHQIVLVQYSGERVAFLGDLIPTPHHLSPHVVSAYDDFPIQTEIMKQQILDQAVKDGWLLVFSHGHPNHAGYLIERRDDQRVPGRYFRPVDLS